jgi:nitroreductase
MCPSHFTPLSNYREIPPEEIMTRSESFNTSMQKRRTVRSFSDKNISLEVVNNFIRSAGSAPSGANKQPWHFVIVADTGIKNKIREAAELEEKKFYSSLAPKEWLNDLEPLGTNSDKPFLDTAPYLIVIFEKKYDEQNGIKKKLYYTKESVGIATGILITAIHNAGLVSLTHTPSRMNFLNEILKRPSSERPFLILAVGYPAENTVVPNIKRKSLDEISSIF